MRSLLRPPFQTSGTFATLNISEFDAVAEQCHDDHLSGGQCDGLISFRGTIDSQEVVLDTAATKATRQERLTGATKTDSIRFWGTSPYFDFRLTIADTSAPSTGPSVNPGI